MEEKNNLHDYLKELKKDDEVRRQTIQTEEDKLKLELEMDAALRNVLDAKPESYTQDWPAYDEAQKEEKLIFLDLLAGLCSTLPENNRLGKGRPRDPFADVVFAAISKVYECLSGRRAYSDLTLAYRRGYIGSLPSVTTIFEYLRDPELTPFLYKFIEMTALPFKDMEDTLIVDATGLSSAFYDSWLSHKYRKKKKRQEQLQNAELANQNEEGEPHRAPWNKLHVIIGRASQIVVAIKVTDEFGADCPQFIPLFQQALKNFKPRGVCGDKAYLSRDNIEIIWSAGAVPLIPFKTNSKAWRSKSLGWRKMFYEFRDHRERFDAHYHQRSLIESSFSSLKRKLGTRLMMKSYVGRINESLAKILCYNLCVLIHEAKEHGIKLDFTEDERKNDSPNEN